MGAALSTQVNKDITEIINKSMQSNTSFCSSEAINRINLKLKASGNIVIDSLKTMSSSKVDLRCVANATNTQAMNTDIQQKIKQYAKAKMDGLNLFQFGAATNIDDITNRIGNEINVSTIQQNVASSLQDQNIDLDAGKDIQIKDVTLVMDAQVLNEAIMNIVNKSDGVAALQKTIDQAASTELIGLLTFGSLVVIVIGLIVWWLISRKNKKGVKGKGAAAPLGKLPPAAFTYLPYNDYTRY